MKRTALLLVALTAVAAGCGTSASSIALHTWECAQTVRDQAELQSALAGPIGTESEITAELRSLHAPGLHPVSFLDPSLGTPLPYSSLDAAQRDTLTAWLALAAPRSVRLTRDVFDDPGQELYRAGPDLTSSCPKPAFPPHTYLNGSMAPGAFIQARVWRNADWTELDYSDGTVAQRAEVAVDLEVRHGTPKYFQPAVALLFSETTHDVLESAATAPSALDYDGDGDTVLGSASGAGDRGGLRVSAAQLAVVLLGLNRDQAALRDLLTAAATAEAADLLASAEAPNNYAADQAGAFDGILDVVAQGGGGNAFAADVLGFHRAVLADLAGHPKRAIAAIAHPAPYTTAGLVNEDVILPRLLVDAAAVASGRYGDRYALSTLLCPSCANGNDGGWMLDEAGRIRSNLRIPSFESTESAFSFGMNDQLLKNELNSASSAFRWRLAGCCD